MRLDVLDADTLVRVGWVDVWVSLYWDSRITLRAALPWR